ncbi:MULTISPECIES: PadR family transcriptional regulator [Arthrobacter]|uniref:PadR family transcriptional regulator n=1 Tax=unclassified Arthrobacter TaxID=235627 RepID=UPI0024B96687|nr:PadR family transcriptional regulator [Arthrobacter sp. H35-MC1]MDJ0317010.1 PadR family transcriptional regulator [Arthrobacter sp. H35-MC1]
MRQQLSPLAMAILGLLVERAMHPYEMYQLLVQRHEDRILKVRPGTLYHAMGRLAAAELVETVGTDRDGNRPERTTYAILAAGREQLTIELCQLLSQPVKEYPRFPQALSEAHNLPAASAIELLGQRTVALEEEVATLESQTSVARAREVPEQYWINVDYQQHQLRSELDWIHKLRANIRNGSLPWGIGTK